MKVQITTLKNNKLLREFADDKAFLGYVEFNNSKIKNIEVLDEATLPELQKAVEVAKPSMSKGWGVLPKSAFGSITSPEKADSVGFSDDKPIATEFRYEPTQPSDKAVKDDANDKVYLDGAKTEQSKVNQEPAEKEVKPEPQKEAEKEDKDTTVDTKEEKVSTDTPEKEETKSKDKEEKKEVKESVEDTKKKYRVIDKDRNYEDFNTLEEMNDFLKYDQGMLDEKDFLSTPEDFERWAKTTEDGLDMHIEVVDESYNEELKESVNEYLQSVGVESEENTVEEGLFGFGAGSKEDMEKALIIAYVKGLEKKTFFGMGLVTKKDLANFDEYKRKYDEYMGNNGETIEADYTTVENN